MRTTPSLTLLLSTSLFLIVSLSCTLLVYKQSAKFALAQLIVLHMVSFAAKDISTSETIVYCLHLKS